jgi:DNA-binding PucR family transcriptional regulator
MAVDTSALSEDGLIICERFGLDAFGWSIENAEMTVAAVFASMPSLEAEAGLPSIFLRGMRASVLREMRMADGEDLDPSTDECADVARDFARRGLDLTTLLETIRIGSRVASGGYIRAASVLIEDPEERADAIARLTEVFFSSLERFSTQMSETYQSERERWLASRSAERLGFITSLLAGRPVDRRRMRDVLRYDLDGDHVAVVAWATETDDDALRNLETVIADELEARGATSSLVVEVGVGAAWGWGTVNGGGGLERRSDPPTGVSVAISQVRTGELGFRRAHREAMDVEHLLRLAVPSMPQRVCYADVELAALLTSDLESAQYFVRGQLGPLAIDDERMERLRTTLWLYLENERSVATVANLQFVARNTVTYRVKQAETLIGRRIEDARLNLQPALLLTRVLGHHVLREP